VLYLQNGDRFVTIDAVASVHAMYTETHFVNDGIKGNLLMSAVVLPLRTVM